MVPLNPLMALAQKKRQWHFSKKPACGTTLIPIIGWIVLYQYYMPTFWPNLLAFCCILNHTVLPLSNGPFWLSSEKFVTHIANVSKMRCS